MLDVKQQISSEVGKILRDTFGKGPESIYTSCGHTMLVIYIRNFMTPPERVLMEEDQEHIVIQMRMKLMNGIIPQIKNFVERMTGNPLREVYFDWNLHNKSGMIVGISPTPFSIAEPIDERYLGKNQIDSEIIKISKNAQKSPDEHYSCQLNPRTLISIRNGILVRIEKEFIRLGYQDLLRSVKLRLEKSYLHNNSNFDNILENRVIDVFVDWDFDLDKSVILLILNPSPPKSVHNQLTLNVDTE